MAGLDPTQARLVAETQARFGRKPAIELECLLKGQIAGFSRLVDPEHEQMIRALAKERGVTLPA